MRVLGAAALAALLLAGALPATAGAHSIVRIGGTKVTYLSADATSLNTLTGRVNGGRIELHDPTVDGGIDPGTCDPGDITDDGNAWIIQVFCPRGGIDGLRIDLGEREDTATLDLPVEIELLGGGGADTLSTCGLADSVAGNQRRRAQRRRRRRPAQRRGGRGHARRWPRLRRARGRGGRRRAAFG
jgi:hypothetical protein